MSSVPVNRSKCVEVLHHDVVQISESIQFPEIVQVGHPILPQSWNVIERPDKAAAVRVRLSDHRHGAAVARACRRHFHPAERQQDWAAPHTPPGHPDTRYAQFSTHCRCLNSPRDKCKARRLVLIVSPPDQPSRWNVFLFMLSFATQ